MKIIVQLIVISTCRFMQLSPQLADQPHKGQAREKVRAIRSYTELPRPIEAL